MEVDVGVEYLGTVGMDRTDKEKKQDGCKIDGGKETKIKETSSKISPREKVREKKIQC